MPLVPEVLALNDYFRFMKKYHYITEEQYGELNNLCVNFYSGKIEKPSQLDASLSSDAKSLLSNKDIDYEKLLEDLFEKNLMSADKGRKKYGIKVDKTKKQFIAFNVNMINEFLSVLENL